MKRIFLFFCLFPVLLVSCAGIPKDVFYRDLWFSKDGKTITLESEKEIREVSFPKLKTEKTYKTSGEETSIAYHPDSDLAAALSADGSTVTLYHIKTAEKGSELSFDHRVLSVDFDQTGKELLADSTDEIKAEIIDIETGDIKSELSGFSTAAPVYHVSFSPDGENVLWNARGTFALQSIADGSFGAQINLNDFPSVYRLSDDSAVLAVAVSNDTYDRYLIRFFDTASGEEIKSYECGKTPVLDLKWSDNGTLYAADASAFYVFDSEGSEAKQIEIAKNAGPGTEKAIRLFDVSPDGKSAVFLMGDNQLKKIDFE